MGASRGCRCPAAEQVKAVAARLKELNLRFDGAVVPTIENGVVRELEFNTDDVTDLRPVRVLSRLRALGVPALETATVH